MMDHWIRVADRLPEDDMFVLAIVSGKPTKNITFVGAYCFAEYSDGGWIIEEYLEWENPTVTHWAPLPEPPKEG